MEFIELTSKENQLVKQTHELLQAKYRAQKQLFLAEGLRLAEEAAANCKIAYCLFTENFVENERGLQLLQHIEEQGAKLYRVPAHILEHCSDAKTPQGIICVCRPQKELDLSSLSENPLLLLCDAVRDPGNMGTIFRLAYAVGADGIILLPDCVEAYNPKVVRSSMGGIFNIPFVKMSNEDAYAVLQEKNITVVLADSNAQKLYWQQDFTKASAVLLGNEANGLTDFWNNIDAESVILPMPGGAESLNVAMTASAICYEVLRQRLG